MMNTIRYYIPFFLLILSIASCSSGHKTADDGIYFQDYDNIKMFVRNADVRSDQAHSGNFSTYTDETHEYSLTFEMDYSYAKSKGYRSMKAEGWIYTDNKDAVGALVTSIESSVGAPTYANSDIKSFVKQPREWTKISCSIKIPENSPDGSIIKIYLWSPAKSKIFMDDLEVKFTK